MRNAFVAGLLELAADDDRIVLLTGDLGFTVLEPFAEAEPGHRHMSHLFGVRIRAERVPEVTETSTPTIATEEA